ncbi:hypothetical protein FVE85_7636 [Porphyridium purpureum]|uniref:Uncharacterized protein n=1 Tax=Porphyridium purpureum TaxID=35688 RepID=A0A5J4Z7V0_PORPP|nr:hypothetical protein FVE85_7636 [Porphyridium purpureum]|eukprot:POR5165..scf295_1
MAFVCGAGMCGMPSSVRVRSRVAPLGAGGSERRARPRGGSRLHMAADSKSDKRGVTNGDVLKYGVLGTAACFGVYFALQATGMDSNQAGTVTSGVLGIGSVLAWTSTYIFRVANKDMTYAQQLKDYENAVIQKRFEELSEEELEALAAELEDEKKAN